MPCTLMMIADSMKFYMGNIYHSISHTNTNTNTID